MGIVVMATAEDPEWLKNVLNDPNQTMEIEKDVT